MLDQNLFIFPPKNARGWNDQDYNCNCYTYLEKVLDIILTIGLNLIETTVSMFHVPGLPKNTFTSGVKLLLE